MNKAMERIPHREMDAPEAIRELLNRTLGDKLDALRGTGKKDKPRGRGKKIQVPAGKSYSTPVIDTDSEKEDKEGLDEVEVDSKVEVDSEEKEEDNNVETLLKETANSKRKVKGKAQAPPRRAPLPLQVSDSESEDKLPDLDMEPDNQGAGGSW